MSKREKMRGKEVTLKDVILEIMELKSKVFDLTEKIKELESKISKTERDLDSRSPGEISVGNPIF